MIKAVVFDIDGTLYDEWQIYLRLFWRGIFSLKTLRVFKKVRLEIRQLQREFNNPSNRLEFLNLQNSLIASKLGLTYEEVEKRINGFFYSDFFYDKFKSLKLYKGVKDLIFSLKNDYKLKIGFMSDFPINKRIFYLLGVEDSFSDVLYSSEETGYLKPHPLSFSKILLDLNLPKDNILYVGNSQEYDIKGAKNLGLKAAFFSKNEKSDIADFTFFNYEDLKKYILNNI